MVTWCRLPVPDVEQERVNHSLADDRTVHCAMINKYYKISDNGLVIYELLPSVARHGRLFIDMLEFLVIFNNCYKSLGKLSKNKTKSL